MRARCWILTGLGLAVLAGCQERLTTPGECPALCPGNPIQIRDTVLLPIQGSDSSFFGYTSKAARSTLLVSSGLPAGEFRSFVRFPAQRIDSIPVDGATVGFTVDSVVISFAMQARDSTATGLTLYVHRLPITVDSTATFAEIEALLTTGSILDSIQVPDTLHAGTIEAFLTEDELARVVIPEADSGRIAIGVTVRASKPTGVRLALDLIASTAAPRLESRGVADVPDEARKRQVVAVTPANPDDAGYVFTPDLSQAADPDLLYVGGPSAARALLRFQLPPALKDTAQLLRATLELVPAAVFNGLPNSELGDTVAVRGVVADLGAKSPPLQSRGLFLTGGLPEATADTVRINVFALVAQWTVTNGPPSIAFLGQVGEGNSFMQPVFFSTRSAMGHPRLKLVYALPSRPGQP